MEGCPFSPDGAPFFLFCTAAAASCVLVASDCRGGLEIQRQQSGTENGERTLLGLT